MKTQIEINIENYLSDSEIKELVKETIANEVKELFKNEANAQRLLSNISYQIVFDEVDKIIADSRKIIIDKTMSIINDSMNYSVFRSESTFSKASLASTIVDETIKSNKQILIEKVKEQIINKDHSKVIWERFEQLGENFASMIYEIVSIGKKIDHN